MRRACLVIGILSPWVLSLTVTAGLARGEAERPLHPQNSGCVHVAVCDSATGTPLGFAQCAALSLRKGAIADSLGRGLLCGLRPGTVVLTTRLLGYSPRNDTINVRKGRTDTLRVRLALQPLPLGTTRDTSAKYLSH